MLDSLPQLSPFAEVALLLLVSALLGAVLVWLKQPLLITYIAVGIALGPAGIGLVHGNSALEAFAQLGVTVLLFIVGLKLDLQHIRHLGPVALATGLGQLAFTIVIGFAITLALGRPWIEALYVAIALTFSSTIIVVKLLSDKRELDSLHGRIAIGFLVVQDLAVVVAMMAMSASRDAASAASWTVLSGLGLRLAIATVLTVVVMRWVLPWCLPAMARSQELLLLFAVAWGVSLAALGEWAGFSKEAGAFLAGFSLASTSYRDVIGARLSSLRDFLLLFFFIELGAGLELSALGAEVGPAAALSLFVLLGNPLIVMAIMGAMGYRKRTSFLAGLTVAQISEFSIIFVAMGISMGHVGDSALALTTLVGITTITLSTYMILYSHPLYTRLSPLLSIFERAIPFREIQAEQSAISSEPFGAIVVGLGRYGTQVLRRLREAGVHVLGIDVDPEVVHDLQRQGFEVRYGDGEDDEWLQTLPLRDAQWLVCTLPAPESCLAVVGAMRQSGFGGNVALALRDPSMEHAIAVAKVQRVLRPFVDAADHAAEMLVTDIRGGSLSARG